MAAHGSGAAARSIRDNAIVMNVDVGGGTAKIAICAEGRVTDLTALDVGARLICLDQSGRIARIEEAGRRFGAELGIKLELGAPLALDGARALAAAMAERLFEAMDGGSPAAGGRGRCCVSMRWPGAPSPRRSRFPAASPNTSTAARPAATATSACCWRRKFAPAPGLGAEARRPRRRHPRHRDRRFAIHHAGERQHHLRLAARCAAAAQPAGDRARFRARRRGDRCRGGGGCDHGAAQAPRPRRCRHSGCRIRAVARLGHLPAPRRILPGRGRRACRHSSPAAIRWCSPATATSAG